MIVRNPTGRDVRLEILTGQHQTDEESVMTLTIGARATVDLARYQRALDALAGVAQAPADD